MHLYTDKYYDNDDDYYYNDDDNDNNIDNDNYCKDDYYKSYNDDIYGDDDYYNNKTAEEDKDIDDDLAGYFSDARIFTSKKTSNVKKRVKKIIYKIDDKIVVCSNKSKNNGIILFGPYDVNKKQMYQIELDNGDIVEADDKHIAYQ